MNIEFEHCDVSFRSLIDWDVFPKDVKNILDVAFQNGGYIAGGFATEFAKCVFGTYSKTATTRTVARYLHHLGYHLGNVNDVDVQRARLIHKGTNGDIDIWFPDRERALMAIDECVEKFHVDNFPSPKSFAHDFVVCGNGKTILIQFIKEFVGMSRDVVSTFDITNAMAYIDNDTLYVPRELRQLCKEKKIQLNTSLPVERGLNEFFTFKRIFKWQNKHEFSRGLTEESMNYVKKIIEHMMSQVKHDESMVMNDVTLAKNLKRFHDMMPADLLLALSTYDSSQDYDSYFKRFLQRHVDVMST